MEIALEQVELRYGRHAALQGIDLAMSEGVWGLLGPNGAGKSTLMKIVATLLVPRRGRVRVGPWRLPDEQHEVRRRLGYLPQEFGLPGNLSGREYLRYAAAIKGAPAAEADRLLAAVSLEEAGRRHIRGYSGGMKQRLAIAQALLGDPDLLLVDEPTAGLDPEQRTSLRTLLAQRRAGRVTLFSTHVVADLAQVADRVVVLHRGQVRFVGTLDELAARAEGRVWTLEAQPEAPCPPGAAVLAERVHDGRLRRRLLADTRPHPEAEPAVPTLEEGYLSVIPFGGQAPSAARPAKVRVAGSAEVTAARGGR
jgi:ABC-2 type transport system ATP-binding protein